MNGQEPDRNWKNKVNRKVERDRNWFNLAHPLGINGHERDRNWFNLGQPLQNQGEIPKENVTVIIRTLTKEKWNVTVILPT